MKNLEQIRARNAWSAKSSGQNFEGKEGGLKVAKTIPPLIQNHGLLQTLAYANAENTGMKNILNYLAKHLSDPEIQIV
ncbi:MAG: type III-B CRISPR module-associated protein Cmr5, partial [Puniceicoccales bacterium]